MQTQHLAAPDRATHHASSFTIWRDACAPFRSNAGLTQRFCGAYERECAQPLRLQRDVLGKDVSPSPASAVSTVCFRLGHPSTACLATRREAQPRCVLTDFLLPTMLRLRALAPYRFPASLRSFRFALEPCTCTQTHETGESSVSRRPIRFGGPSGLARGVLLPRTSGRTEPLTPVSPPHSPSLRFRTSGASWGRLDCGTKPLREDRGPLLQSEVPSIDR